jgi:hypothetical protein
MTRDAGEFDGTEEWLDSRRGILGKGALASAALALGLPTMTGGAAAEKREEAFATVEFENQTGDGSTITVDSVILEDGGYVAVHDARLFEGQVTASVIGVSDYLEPGMYRHLEIDLFDVKGAEFDRDAIQEEQPLVPMPHMETGDNEEYDFVDTGGEQDGPYVRSGQPVVDIGFVAGGSDSSVEFRNQQTDGTTVMVDSVTLSGGGFVAIHDGRLLQGKVTESVIGVSHALERGTHHDVEVPLFDVKGGEFDRDALGETQPLVAMPHVDTDGNGEYDFVATGGEQDGPYVRDGNAVVDLGFAVVE